MAEIFHYADDPLEYGERLVCDYLDQHLGYDFKVFSQHSMKNVNHGKNRDTRWQVRPDFLVLHSATGKWVLEVKDYRPETIREFQQSKVILIPGKNNGKPIKEKNPYVQVREYVACLKAEFRNCADSILQPHGNPSLPYGWAVLFTNIRRADFQAHASSKHVDMDRTLFIDDLKDSNGAGFEWQLMRWLETVTIASERSSEETALGQFPPRLNPKPFVQEKIENKFSLPPFAHPQKHTDWGRIVLGAASIAAAILVVNHFRDDNKLPPGQEISETVSTDCLNVRSLPSAKSPKNGVLPIGTKVRVLGETQDGWHDIEADVVPASKCGPQRTNVRGYANSQYLVPMTP